MPCNPSKIILHINGVRFEHFIQDDGRSLFYKVKKINEALDVKLGKVDGMYRWLPWKTRKGKGRGQLHHSLNNYHSINVI